MAWFKRLSRFTILALILAVILTLGLAVNVPVSVQAQLSPDLLSRKLPNQWENSFTPPPSPGAPVPDNRVGGATRSNNCIRGDGSLMALVPASGVGQTVAEYPTVFWYTPQTSAVQVEFVLRDANNQEVYSTEYALAKSGVGERSSAQAFGEGVSVASVPGIMRLPLPAFANFSPLEIGQDYYWDLALICNPIDRSGDIVVTGGIKRVQPDPTLALRVQQATPQERVALYADARLWYETLTALADLPRDRPNNNDLADVWNKLLKSVGLNPIF